MNIIKGINRYYLTSRLRVRKEKEIVLLSGSARPSQ